MRSALGPQSPGVAGGARGGRLCGKEGRKKGSVELLGPPADTRATHHEVSNGSPTFPPRCSPGGPAATAAAAAAASWERRGDGGDC